MLPDDHPWPELGSVSRGATRGNQGSKGSLSSPHSDGRCVLQLRVQPGVLAVTLTRQASEWYRTLDDAVTSALKLTKGYWRKARRRQDYNAQADQDHIELNEWLQQLKDKVMAHLEMLIAKGEIRGPPYVMSEDQDFPFLRKFIERQAARIPHNPRLRGSTQESHNVSSTSLELSRSETPEGSKTSNSFVDDGSHLLENEERNVASSSSNLPAHTTMRPPSRSRISSLIKEAQTNKQELESARRTLTQTRKDVQTAFQKYTGLLETERRAQVALTLAEERRGELMASFVDLHAVTSHSNGSPHNRTNTSPFLPQQMIPSPHHSMPSPSFTNTPRHPTATALTAWDPERHVRPASTYSNGAAMAVNQYNHNDRPGHWTHADVRMNMSSNNMNSADAAAMRQTVQTGIPMPTEFMQMPVGRSRKHGRDWAYGEMEDHSTESEDLSGMPPRKRAHQMGSNLGVPHGFHMVSTQDEGLSASQPPPHIAAPPSHFRDAPT